MRLTPLPLAGQAAPRRRGVKVPHAVLVHAVLSGSDLTAADFSSVTLCNAVIDYVNLDRANFTHADISEHPPAHGPGLAGLDCPVQDTDHSSTHVQERFKITDFQKESNPF